MKDGKLHTNKLKASFSMNTCNEGVKGNAWAPKGICHVHTQLCSSVITRGQRGRG